MFRKMRRFQQQISEEECIRVLKEQPRGVLSMLGDDGYPTAFHSITGTRRRTTNFISTAQKSVTSWMPLLPTTRSATA